MAFLKCFAISMTIIQTYCAVGIFALSFFLISLNFKLVNRSQISIAILIYAFSLSLSITPSLYITTFNDYINALLFPSIFLSSYIFFNKHSNAYILLKYIGIVAIILAYFNLIRLSTEINLIANRPMQSNAGNTLVALLPFVFLWNNKLIRYGLLIIVFCGCIISLKRSGFVIFLCVLLFYFTYRKYNGTSFKLLKYAIIISLIGLLILPNIEITQPLLERLENIGEDGGSGRNHLAEMGLEVLSRNGLPEWVLGNGYRGFADKILLIYDRNFTCAHNDYIEILCDCGIIAFISFIAFLIKMYNYSKLIYRRRSQFAIPYTCCIVVFIGATLFVCSFVHFWYYLPMYCLFGATQALTENEDYYETT